MTARGPRAAGLAVAAAIALQSLAATFGKLAADRRPDGVAALITSPLYLAGLAALAAQAVAWAIALRRLPLHVAYPFMSLVVPVNLAVAALGFGEPVGPRHLVGFALITAGVALAAREAR